MFTRFVLWAVAFPLCMATGMGQGSQEPPTQEQQSKARLEELAQELAQLRAEFEQVKSAYGQRIARIEEQLVKLQPASAATISPLPASTPVASAAAAPSSGPQTFTGGERTLQALNPEISLTGDFTGRLSDNSANDEFNRFNFDGMELAVQHPLDPYSQAKFFITFEDGEFDLEEGYVSWESLPGKLGLKVGRFHTNFGKLNRYHKHALPWVDRDLPTQSLFGEEGLIGTGLSVSWLPPHLPIADSNEAYFEVVNNDNELAFSGRGFADPVYVGHFLSYYDVTDNAYFEWGVSAATSHWDLAKQRRSTVYGVDLSYRWQPLRRALYDSFEFRGELFYNDRQDWSGGSPFSLFVSGEYQLNRRWFAGLRYQYAEMIEDDNQQVQGFSPFLTFWQSEFVRLRAQYDFLDRNFGSNENRFFLQFTWSLGPHKHEAY